MTKYRIEFEETLKYRREMVFEVADGTSDDVIDNILTKAEHRAECAGDVALILENNGVKIVERPDEDLRSPYDVEIEIDSLDEV